MTKKKVTKHVLGQAMELIKNGRKIPMMGTHIQLWME